MDSGSINVISQCNYLVRTTNKAKEQSTISQERLQKKRQQGTGRSNITKRTPRGKDLALSAEVHSLDQKKQKWLFAKHKHKS